MRAKRKPGRPKSADVRTVTSTLLNEAERAFIDSLGGGKSAAIRWCIQQMMTLNDKTSAAKITS